MKECCAAGGEQKGRAGTLLAAESTEYSPPSQIGRRRSPRPGGVGLVKWKSLGSGKRPSRGGNGQGGRVVLSQVGEKIQGIGGGLGQLTSGSTIEVP